jgi:hypothetical protein
MADNPMGPAADDGDHVARADASVQHPDLVARREDVGEHEELSQALEPGPW